MLLEDVKKHAKELKELQAAVVKAQSALEAHNKAFMAFLVAKLGLPSDAQMHLAELISLSCEKIQETQNTPPPA